MRESQIENYLKREIEKLGGQCLKFVSPGNKGVPDRLLILPGGKVIFAELKNGNKGRLSALQVRMQTVLKSLKCRTYVLTTKPEVDKLITELREEL
ncbi:VRR-NUC domain-containing protein [Lysinibacillus sp.]|uniref:VRR-NUC domain-containing protein n=1 Tax=Lysinibacillus sp. TaxID=1869345 RepID=UPI0028A02491|nr:VRR-NUC domain-containing protein [Lysinibacillus sp.]